MIPRPLEKTRKKLIKTSLSHMSTLHKHIILLLNKQRMVRLVPSRTCMNSSGQSPRPRGNALGVTTTHTCLSMRKQLVSGVSIYPKLHSLLFPGELLPHYLPFSSTRSYPVWGTRFSMLDWVRVAVLSCTKGVWYIYDRDTG